MTPLNKKVKPSAWTCYYGLGTEHVLFTFVSFCFISTKKNCHASSLALQLLHNS